MATDYDAPRKTDEELAEDSLEELKALKSNYVIGMDPSNGKGKANSAGAVIARRNGRLVAEFCDPFGDGFDLADEMILAGRTVFHRTADAYIAWEVNGPGESIHKRFQAEHYERPPRPLFCVAVGDLRSFKWIGS